MRLDPQAEVESATRRREIKDVSLRLALRNRGEQPVDDSQTSLK
jgi:hypothetical protein